ncbi:MAG TPA: DALR anticodon-binding domain-containing protein, partial [Acidobacteriota bacterium]|nr:DALR anticodon-binding domain-containing protein [Acidobacteriota bacterium]
TFVRHLRAVGRRVEVQNYIDNTGVQVADVVVGFHYLRKLSLEKVARIAEPFDYYCWDLYAEVSEWYRQDESRLALRESTLRAIEDGDSELSLLADHVSTRIVKAHLRTMDRLGIRYDLLPRESEILHLRFWDEAFQMLKSRRAIYLAKDGANRGCWVMDLPGENGQPDETKIIVRSNGTVTYVGKDIAYQLWKFGLLNRTFHYRLFRWNDDGETVWITTTEASGDEPDFGGADFVYNVIDVRQSYLQRVVVQGLRSLGFHREADRSIHFSYEMVALSPACCDELNIELSEEERQKPYVEVSGRKGLGVKADDLIDKLVEKSLDEVNQRQPDLSEQARQEIARQIAVGALRYFMLKYTRNAVIAFDFSEALSFEGETGPYLQYSIVRANNIFRKAQERLPGWNEGCWRNKVGNCQFPEEFFEDSEIWNLVLQIARIEDTVFQSIDSLELSQTARHAFSLAQQFNLFYHRYHILSEEDELKREFYLAIADSARRGLLRLTDLTGIQVPERM